MTLESCALVLLGGFLGGIARLFLAETIGRGVGETFPWGTLAVNVSGALAIGAFAGASRAAGGPFASDLLREFVVIGLLGGYTTVSVLFIADAESRARRRGAASSLYVAASASLCIAAVAIGYWSLIRIFV